MNHTLETFALAKDKAAIIAGTKEGPDRWCMAKVVKSTANMNLTPSEFKRIIKGAKEQVGKMTTQNKITDYATETMNKNIESAEVDDVKMNDMSLIPVKPFYQGDNYYSFSAKARYTMTAEGERFVEKVSMTNVGVYIPSLKGFVNLNCYANGFDTIRQTRLDASRWKKAVEAANKANKK